MDDFTKKNDSELISSVVNSSCSDSYLELCRRYEKVFYKVCQRYSSVFTSVGIPIADILDDKDSIIYFCVKKFDPTRGAKFSTFVGNYARFLCLKSILSKKHCSDFSDDSINELIESRQIAQEYESSNTIFGASLVNEAVEKLENPIHRKIIHLKYYAQAGPVTWKTIANDMKISVPTVIGIHGRAIRNLKRKIKTLELQ